MTQIIDGIKSTFRYYTTIIELSRLSDKELSDLGMSRIEIIHIANKIFINSTQAE